MDTLTFNWSDIAFGSKQVLSGLRATFIAAPRELSAKRLTQLVKRYLPLGNIVLGIASEPYVSGLEQQPQFRMLQAETVEPLLAKVADSPSKHRLYTLHYSQRDLCFIFDKVDFRQVVLVNGSWYHTFHLRPEFYTLTKRRIPYEMVSPFVDEQEAEAYPRSLVLGEVPASGSFTDRQMLDVVALAAKHSYDYAGIQAAVALGRKAGSTYELLGTTHNEVVPYETYAMHFGASREKNFSPLHDLNHYDTVHAEMLALVKAQKEGIDLKGVTLFINLLPCPHCARTLSKTDLNEIVYAQDHSAGYAIGLLERSGKQVRRLIPGEKTVI